MPERRSRPMARLAVLAAALALGIAAAPSGPARAQDYRLAVGDEVEFDLLDDAEEIRTLTVAQDGQVQLPLIGTIRIGGRTVPEAIDDIRAVYMERGLLRDPKVSLAIASFRPVFVLGDVMAPGEIGYRPQMTVEQAVGLAGGPAQSTDNSGDQLLTEASLRGELRIITSEIARQAAVTGRLRAMLDDADTPSLDAVPEAARDLVDPDLFADYARVEAEILESDRSEMAEERASIEDQIAALDQEIALLEERVATQRANIEGFSAERDRIVDLVARGSLTRGAAADAEADLYNAEIPLLESQRRQTEAVRQRAALRRDLEESEAIARRGALADLQAARLEIDRLLARHASTEERVYLVTSWQSTRSQDAFSIETEYRVRRDEGDGLEVLEAGLTDRLLPGDVLLVTIEIPG